MGDYTTLRYTVEERVARITLDRPRYRNAQSRLLLEELDGALARAADDAGVRVICLFGAGDHFSAGHDLGTPEELADRQRRPWGDGIRGWYEYTWGTFFENTLRWRNLPKPTVAGVQGYCIWGGWMIASAMDVIFAADDALFLGHLFQYFSMPWDLPPRKVKELIFEPRFVDATEAAGCGLVNRVVPRGDLEAETMAWARRVAENDPFELRLAKLATNQAQDAQGFPAHVTSAHAFYTLGRLSEYDPGAANRPTDERRRPGVRRALENYRARAGEPGGAGEGPAGAGPGPGH